MFIRSVYSRFTCSTNCQIWLIHIPNLFPFSMTCYPLSPFFARFFPVCLPFSYVFIMFAPMFSMVPNLFQHVHPFSQQFPAFFTFPAFPSCIFPPFVHHFPPILQHSQPFHRLFPPSARSTHPSGRASCALSAWQIGAIGDWRRGSR